MNPVICCSFIRFYELSHHTPTMAAVLCILLVFLIVPSACVLPDYIPALLAGRQVERNDLIEEYFELGFTYPEILVCLVLIHGITLSLRQLKRVLSARNLRRRKQPSDLQDVADAISEELTGSGSCFGYRFMHQHLRRKYRLVVDKETVRIALKVLDPNAVEDRTRGRLRRRKYSVKGPNYLWHLDGYDKLKPFGFCIHGCIDGFSRRLMWLEVAETNNDPEVVAQYFLDTMKQVGGVPLIVRGDCGTENGNIALIQRYLRSEYDDEFAGEKSFMYGKSTSNQRIEAWWSIFKRINSSWWIQYFKDLRDSGAFNDSNVVHTECIRFCFMDIIQEELYKLAQLWNSHLIRPTKNSVCPSGKPDILYFIPEVTGSREYKCEFDNGELTFLEDALCRRPLSKGCSPEFNELAHIIMEEQDLVAPSSIQEAEHFYTTLLGSVEDLW